MLCDLYDCPVSILRSEQGGALGAAILAGVGAGVYPSIEYACERMIERKETLQPIPENTKAYRPYFELYKSLYGTLQSKFRELAAI